MGEFEKLEKEFDNKDLLTLALTHRSYINEHNEEQKTNERLEFLGDAILEFVVSDKIFTDFMDKEEGFLTALRANMVNTVNLARVARKLELGKYIRLSKGEEDSNGRDNPSILADTMEAVIGAIYKDKGLTKTIKFIEDIILVDLTEMSQKPLKDAKSRLQEYIQAKGMPTPKYVVVSEKGPDHQKTFDVEVRVNGDILAKGVGKSKSEAEQDSAKNALSNMASKSSNL